MQRTTRLENLSGKWQKTEFQNIAVGRLLIDIVESFQVDVGLRERGKAFVHAIGIKIEPIRDWHIQLHQLQATRHQLKQRFPARYTDRHQIVEEIT